MVGMVSDNGEVIPHVADPHLLLGFLTANFAQVSFRAVTATGLVKGAAAMQGTSPVASAALGRAMVRTVKLCVPCKQCC